MKPQISQNKQAPRKPIKVILETATIKSKVNTKSQSEASDQLTKEKSYGDTDRNDSNIKRLRKDH